MKYKVNIVETYDYTIELDADNFQDLHEKVHELDNVMHMSDEEKDLVEDNMQFDFTYSILD